METSKLIEIIGDTQDGGVEALQKRANLFEGLRVGDAVGDLLIACIKNAENEQDCFDNLSYALYEIRKAQESTFQKAILRQL